MAQVSLFPSRAGNIDATALGSYRTKTASRGKASILFAIFRRTHREIRRGRRLECPEYAQKRISRNPATKLAHSGAYRDKRHQSRRAFVRADVDNGLKRSPHSGERSEPRLPSRRLD